MKKIICWQPELSQLIIYWSLTFIVLFFSLILSLENTRPYWKSNVVLGIFLLFLFLGLRRSFVLQTKTIKIRYAAFWKDKEISFHQIDSIYKEPKGVQMKFLGEEHGTTYLMQKKGKTSFLHYINEQIPQRIIEKK